MTRKKPKLRLTPNLINPNFKYVRASQTDIRETFKRVIREREKAERGITDKVIVTRVFSLDRFRKE